MSETYEDLMKSYSALLLEYTRTTQEARISLEMALRVMHAVSLDRDCYKEALLSISSYPNCPRGIYSLLLEALDA